MPTVCELKIQAKAKGLKGYSKMKKADLEKLVGGASKPRPVQGPRNLKKGFGIKRLPKKEAAGGKKKQTFSRFLKQNKDKYDEFLSDELDDIGSNAYDMTAAKERQMKKKAKENAMEKMKKLYESGGKTESAGGKKDTPPKKPDPPSSPPSESNAAPADDYAELMKEIEETHALNTAGKGSKAMNSYPVQSSKYKKLNAAKNKANKALITAINDHRKSEGNMGIKFKDIRMSGVPYFVRMAKKYGVPFATTEKIFRSYMRTQF